MTAPVTAKKPVAKVAKKPTSKKTGKVVVRVPAVAGKPAPTGKVRVKITKGKTSRYVTAKLSRGKRNVTLPRLKKGTWTIRVSYFGDANYSPRGYAKVAKVKVTK